MCPAAFALTLCFFCLPLYRAKPSIARRAPEPQPGAVPMFQPQQQLYYVPGGHQMVQPQQQQWLPTIGQMSSFGGGAALEQLVASTDNRSMGGIGGMAGTQMYGRGVGQADGMAGGYTTLPMPGTAIDGANAGALVRMQGAAASPNHSTRWLAGEVGRRAACLRGLLFTPLLSKQQGRRLRANCMQGCIPVWLPFRPLQNISMFSMSG